MKRIRNRSGAAIVELAVCLPTILLLVFASVECCSMIFLQQSLTVSSYEGTRQAIKFDATNSKVTTACTDMLTNRRVKSATITLSPSDVSGVARGSMITVQVSAPCAPNSWMPYSFFKNRNVVAKSTMVKE